MGEAPQTRTRIMRNMADPAAAFRWWRLPGDGLARIAAMAWLRGKMGGSVMVMFSDMRTPEEADRILEDGKARAGARA